mmetsp:Transcript_8441/g.20880  ORF Transcript_8441/g.20880 Transcript_8441/m.20880 type:complete len:90 (-) Transcript_8441:52-321(-)
MAISVSPDPYLDENMSCLCSRALGRGLKSQSAAPITRSLQLKFVKSHQLHPKKAIMFAVSRCTLKLNHINMPNCHVTIRILAVEQPMMA